MTGMRGRKYLFLILLIGVLVSSAAMHIFMGARSVSADSVSSSAECMVLMDVKTNRVLYEKNRNLKRPMASTTKILTAITVIENCTDLEKIVPIPASAVGVEGSSIYLSTEDKLTVLDLLYGLMLQSGNDCAEALAIYTSKTKENFAKLMNETARKIGAQNSNFVTPHGLHHPDHYTTAYDLALITAHSLRNPVFAKIVATEKHSAPWAGRSYNRVILNKNKLLKSFDGCDGVKTGYTKKAGRCFVSSATRDGVSVCCAVLNCGPMFEECATLMNRAFKEYKYTEVIAARTKLADVPIASCARSRIAAGTIDSIYLPMRDYDMQTMKIKTVYNKSLKAPIKAGVEIGKILIYCQNELIFEDKLFTIEDADSKSLFDRLKDIAGEWTE